jgi:ribosomal protein S18 acetylase RimI-like enzyme
MLFGFRGPGRGELVLGTPAPLATLTFSKFGIRDTVLNTGRAIIELLDHLSEGVAVQIYNIFQLSYKVEARLVGVEHFPPLRRTASDIQSSNSQFLGLWIGVELAAVVEFTQRAKDLSIDSLVVHPEYFRRGLASQLLHSLLAKVHWRIAKVETASANNPALLLYREFGFSESKRWKTADGIEKVQLMCRHTI